MSADAVRPSRFFLAMIRASLPSEDRQSLAREIELLWAKRARDEGSASANRWLARQATGFVLRVGMSRLVPRMQTLESLFTDARVSLRNMRREPSFVLSFVLTLAVATGVLSAVYSAANWVLLRPVPGVGDAGRLINMRLVAHNRPDRITWDVSQPDLATLRERLPQLAALAAMTPVDVDVRSGNDVPRRVSAELATANYFTVLRARMFAGRPFAAEDERDAQRLVTVLSYEFAQRLSHDPAAVIGTDLRVNGAVIRVVGVAEPGFRGAELPGRPLLWLPPSAVAVADPTAKPGALSDRSFAVWRRMVGRLAEQANAAQVAPAANEIMKAVRIEFPGKSYNSSTYEFRVFDGVGLDAGIQASVRRTLGLLIGAAAFLLCLAIANLTNLALTRSLTRRGTTAIRFALGATRARLTRAVIVETLILGSCGGLVAMVVAGAWSRWFATTQLTEIGGSLEGIHVDLRVAAFAMLTSLFAAALAFLRPALSIRSRSLEQLARRDNAGPSGGILQSTLVGVQVALSVVLVVAALLLARTVANLRSVDLGFPPDRLLTVSANPQLHGYDLARIEQLARDAEERLRGESGVVAAGLIGPIPLASNYYTGGLRREDDVAGKHQIIGAGYYVSPGFFAALGVRVLAGDAAWPADSGSVVISREMAKQLYPGVPLTSLIGRTPVRFKAKLRIASVVEDVKLSDLTANAPPTIFLSLRDAIPGEPLAIYVRTAGPPLTATAAVGRVMASVAPDVPLYAARTARDAVDLQFVERRVMAVGASTLGLLGVALAAIGLYGVLANVVAARRREIAIRSALGATPRLIVGRVLSYGLVPVAVGAIVGAAAATGVSRLLTAQLFGLHALDPAAYGLGLAGTGVVAMIACLPAAYRATRVSIVQMLRSE